MATHRVSFPHGAHSADQRGANRAYPVRAQERHAEANFGLFLLAPMIIVLTAIATAWISKVSFGGSFF